MEKLVNILRVCIALGIIAALLVFGLFVFMVLVGVAVLASAVMWFKRRKGSQSHAVWEAQEIHRTHGNQTVTIIEGVAEEVKDKREA